MAVYTYPSIPQSLSNGDILRFPYSGNTQEFIIPFEGTYRLEVWGAQGGRGKDNSGNYGSYLGYGGYAKGEIKLARNSKLFINVGGAGKDGNTSSLVTGGFNGGGNAPASSNSTSSEGGSGGGATDIRIDENSLYSRVIVAGGAGGSGYPHPNAKAGSGGGLVGTDGIDSTANSSRGTQDSGGVSTGTYGGPNGQPGTFGRGGDGGSRSGSAGGAGGGGGWYGGAGGKGGDANGLTSGGGGSGYVLTSTSAKPSGYKLTSQHYLSKTSLISGEETMPSPNGGTQVGQSGNGYAIITVINVINPPSTPTSMSRPNNARVGQTINVSWTSVPLPTQPDGVTLTSNTVYYEVDFYDGTKWVSVTGKTSATNVNYTIPTMVDTNLAKFRVRAFVEANGSRHYSRYRESSTMTIFNNNKPTNPLAFSAPIASSRYRVGFNYTISWGASTDLDNDPLTYQLDFFNGQTWTNVANGLQATNRSFIVPSGPDTLNAQFRVRAYDGRDYSDYRYTDKFEVFNNTPPNTPRPFTKPESDEMRIIDLQTAYTVSWGPADVEEGEIAKYEVSFRGSSLDNWVVVQDINNPNATNTSMQHILPNVQDSETAQYRVRAYDGQEYGGYTESNYFSMSGNKVTNTSGFNQELMDRMAINQEVRLSWQPAETTRGTQVVYDIEIFDGFTWKEIAYNVPTTSLVFRIPPMEDTPNAKIRIRSKTAFQFGGYVESEWTETKSFTIVNFFIFDSIAVPFLNDVQKKENADYLRQKVNDMRIVNDLPPLVYTDPVIIRYETAIKAVHFDEIEAGLLECFDKNPRAKFANVRTEQELRKVKEYSNQAELIQELPQRIDFICKALMNQ